MKQTKGSIFDALDSTLEQKLQEARQAAVASFLGQAGEAEGLPVRRFFEQLQAHATWDVIGALDVPTFVGYLAGGQADEADEAPVTAPLKATPKKAGRPKGSAKAKKAKAANGPAETNGAANGETNGHSEGRRSKSEVIGLLVKQATIGREYKTEELEKEVSADKPLTRTQLLSALGDLRDRGYVMQQGAKRGTKWVFNPNVSEAMA